MAYTNVHQHNVSMIFCCCVLYVFHLEKSKKIKNKKAIVRCVCSVPILRIKGVMFSLRQLKVVAVLGTWDPCLSAGIGVKPAASLRARCCFIYLKAQVTFLEECRRETCLQGLSAFPLFPSVTSFPVKDEIESHQSAPYPDCQRNRPNMNLYILFNDDTVWFFKCQLKYECSTSR